MATAKVMKQPFESQAVEPNMEQSNLSAKGSPHLTRKHNDVSDEEGEGRHRGKSGDSSRDIRDSQRLSASEKEKKIGHRRVDGAGQVSYKKVQTNQLMASIQLGIEHCIGAMGRYDERDLLMQDFMTVETVSFPKSGSQTTPAHSYADYTFRTFAPLAFRYFLKLFGVQREDFLVSLCNEEMRELSNPGASGSIFYLTVDDEFILKTVQSKEAQFLQKLLPGYYMNLNQNPHTLLPKFFGMFVYQANQKNIRLTVMNNLLPSDVKMHLKFDLKGSTYKRKASKSEKAKKSPTFKDLDFMEILPEGLMLEPETYNALISTLRRDARVLESFRIMDYSLLIGIHNLDLAAKEDMENKGSGKKGSSLAYPSSVNQQKSTRLLAHSTAMESIQAQTEPIDEQEHMPPGGIPARNHKGERLLLFLGIIDILQSYRMRKKLEHTFKSIILDGDTVSVHRPGFYAHRFLDFMADRVFKKITSSMKHSPSKKSKRESLKKSSVVSTTVGGSGGTSAFRVSGSGQDESAAEPAKVSTHHNNPNQCNSDSDEASSVNKKESDSFEVSGAGSAPKKRFAAAPQAQGVPTASASAFSGGPHHSGGAGAAAAHVSFASPTADFDSTHLEAMINQCNLPAVLIDKPSRFLTAGGKAQAPTLSSVSHNNSDSPPVSMNQTPTKGASPKKITYNNSNLSSRESLVTRNYKDTPYHETEI